MSYLTVKYDDENFYGGDLYTALENIIKGNVIAMNKLAVYDKLCCFIILSIEVALSSHFRHLLANLLGIINDASYLISVMANDELVAHQGLFKNTKLYQKMNLMKFI